MDKEAAVLQRHSVSHLPRRTEHHFPPNLCVI